MAKFLIDFCQSHAMFIFVWVDVRASTRGIKWINLANQKCWWCRRMSGSWLETSKTYPIYCTSLHQTRIACQKHFFFSKGKLNSQTASQIGFFFSGFSFRFSFSYFLHFFSTSPPLCGGAKKHDYIPKLSRVKRNECLHMSECPKQADHQI